VAQSASIISSIAQRYASSLFDVALEEKKLDETEKALARFDALIGGSDDLRRLVESPVFTAEQQMRAIDAVLSKAGIGGLAGNLVRLVARNRRLFVMPAMLTEFRKLVAAHRGEATADVTVAHALSAEQSKELAAALKSIVGKDVAVKASVDPSLLGGMVVKIGSRQIDTSLRSKLNSLKLALKEVG
jgi:F-type H+-transporting ATPase subunit delta